MDTKFIYSESVKRIVIQPYSPRWQAEFTTLGDVLRTALGPHALAIHHIGSTSVLGLAAKDVIDVQVTVVQLDIPLHSAFEDLGFMCREGTTHDHCPPGQDISLHELEKRYYSRSNPRVHIHVREAGRYNQRYALLCRDYLRAHSMARDAYAEIKWQLARGCQEPI